MNEKKNILITGGNGGVGSEIAYWAAREGMNVALFSRNNKPRRTPDGVMTVAQYVEKLGGKALYLSVDVKDPVEVRNSVDAVCGVFGDRIDLLVNCASHVVTKNTVDTTVNDFVEMYDTIVKGTFFTTQACLPYLVKSDNPHVVNIVPPLDIKRYDEMSLYTAYATAKYAVSELTLTWAEEFPGINFNGVWPYRLLFSDATRVLLGGTKNARMGTRSAKIMADAIAVLFEMKITGHFWLDELFLRIRGIKSFDEYLLEPGAVPERDIFTG